MAQHDNLGSFNMHSCTLKVNSIYRATLLAAFLTVSLSNVAHATLFDRGSGLIYDDVLNVTWLQDANYANTIEVDGGNVNGAFFQWQYANSWASNLVYHDSVRNVDYSDWRLPTVAPTGADYNGSNYWQSLDSSPKNEMAYMYFVNLGLNSFPGGADQTDITVGSVTIKNLQAGTYWSGTHWDVQPDDGYHFTFITSFGATSAHDDYFTSYAWAVRDGDVSPIPEPQTYAMMLAGLGLLGFSARHRSVN
ncbi:MAG: PEP-CTERM sorting domain-containing protein [Rugosibacter sp.]|nr:PEP-CTERM sorting domain-containing protein [Rugosibacter sp.]